MSRVDAIHQPAAPPSNDSTDRDNRDPQKQRTAKQKKKAVVVINLIYSLMYTIRGEFIIIIINIIRRRQVVRDGEAAKTLVKHAKTNRPA